MNKITFQNFPSTDTPVNANNLNTVQTNVENAIDSIDSLGFHGTALVENDDLNNKTTAGIYYSNSTTITNSLSHCPVTNAGFKLIVEYTTSTSRIVQTLKVNNSTTSATYVRTYVDSWGEWSKVDIKVVLYSSASGSTSGESLSKNISYFDEIEILYSIEGYRKSAKIKTDGSSLVSTMLDGIFVGSTNMVVASQVITLSGTTVTRGNSAGKYINLSSNAVSSMSSVTAKIFKIIGY